VLRAAQTLGLLGGEAAYRRLAASDVAHADEQVGLVVLDDELGRHDVEDAALALEAGELDVLVGGRDHAGGEAARVFIRGARDPLRADARLAEAAPGEIAALRPVARGHDLVGPRGLKPASLPLEVDVLLWAELGEEGGDVGHWP